MTKKQLIERVNAREAARMAAKAVCDGEVNAAEEEYEAAYDKAIDVAAIDAAFEIRNWRISKARAEYNAKIGAIK